MKITIKEGDNLPIGEYELTNAEKLENAKGNLYFGASNRQVLLEYDRIAGRVVKDGQALLPQSLWKIEQEHMNKPIEQFSNEELLTVIRRAENSNVPGSLYQRAHTEWQIRHQQASLENMKTKNEPSFIHIAPGAEVKDLNISHNTMSGEGKFLNNEGRLENATLNKNRYIVSPPFTKLSLLKSFLKIIVGGLITLVLGYLLFGALGWKW